jgi:inosine/guanosine/xanthosine phosphorylase family protein
MSAIEQAVRAIRKRDHRIPKVALILGSGLGSLADSVENATVIPGARIPGYPHAGVAGHRGDLVLGELGGNMVAFLRGRFHRYEGHDMDTLTLPVRLAAELGAPRLIVTNAAGSLRKTMPSGSIMRITSHINTTATNPLLALGKPEENDASSTSLRGDPPYDAEWGRQVDEIALELGIRLYHGAYVWTLGPSYETPSEINYFHRIGGDAVGMSTVPEVTVAARLGMKVLGFSVVTNLGAGLENVSLSHDDVIEVGRSIHARMKRLLVAITRSIPDR